MRRLMVEEPLALRRWDRLPCRGRRSAERRQRTLASGRTRPSGSILFTWAQQPDGSLGDDIGLATRGSTP